LSNLFFKINVLVNTDFEEVMYAYKIRYFDSCRKLNNYKFKHKTLNRDIMYSDVMEWKKIMAAYQSCIK